MELYHNPGVLALVRKRGKETLVGLFNFTEYPAGASLDALGGEYHTPEGVLPSGWRMRSWSRIRRCWCAAERSSHGYYNDW